MAKEIAYGSPHISKFHTACRFQICSLRLSIVTGVAVDFCIT